MGAANGAERGEGNHLSLLVAYVMETGRIVLQGPGQALLSNEEVKRAYLGG